MKQIDEMTYEELLVAYQETKDVIDTFNQTLGDVGDRIKAHFAETGEMSPVARVAVAHRNGYTRTSWDGKGLAGYAVANPAILAFAKETEVAPTITITVKK